MIFFPDPKCVPCQLRYPLFISGDLRGSRSTGVRGDTWIPGYWAPCQLGYPCFYIGGPPGIPYNGGTGGYVDTWLLGSAPTTLSLISFRGISGYPVLWWYWWIPGCLDWDYPIVYLYTGIQRVYYVLFHFKYITFILIIRANLIDEPNIHKRISLVH